MLYVGVEEVDFIGEKNKFIFIWKRIRLYLVWFLLCVFEKFLKSKVIMEEKFIYRNC